MRKNIGSVIILGILIIACIWQTAMLWLGNMSSHDLFNQSATSYEGSLLYPKEIWGNVNRNIYKIEEDNDQDSMRFKLLYELFSAIKKKHLVIEEETKISYVELLSSTTGMIYEYGTYLSLDEIVGQTLETNNNQTKPITIKTLYVDLSESNGNKASVYLIDKHSKVVQKLTIYNPFTYHNKAITYFEEAKISLNIKTYQASLLSPNDSEFFEGNVFYPINNKGFPIFYNEIRLLPLVADLEDEVLMNYVNDLLKHSNSQTKTILKDGATFSNNLNLSVKYSKVGTLEFKKTFNGETTKTTAVEKIGKITHFIKTSQAIPQSLKKGLYLEAIKEDQMTGESYYLFGYQYDNFDVRLSDEVKNQLGISAFLELRIKDSDITSGKWVMLEAVPNHVMNSNFYEFTKESNEAIDEIMEIEGKLPGRNFKLKDLQCVYWVSDMDKSVGLEWVGTL